MTLIKSISGIRGTIGGRTGENLTPADIVAFVSAFATRIRQNSGKDTPKVVVGRDGRISGPMVLQLTVQTLVACGVEVLNADLSTTPGIEMYVIRSGADGGIILTASHNPAEWNALKLLDGNGEFISAEEGAAVLALAESQDMAFAGIEELGREVPVDDDITTHIDAILQDELVDAALVKKRSLKVVVDGINSSGAIAVPALLEAMGVGQVVLLNAEVNGRFAHNPEPLTQHLTGLSETIVKEKADLGIAVDPDVDRLAFFDEKGNAFGEEYTLVAVADYILQHRKGAAVSNLSSSRALRDIAQKHGVDYYASAVGEVNVVTQMKNCGAVIGGEGNGGVIYPPLHYGRDALAGIALFLTFLCRKKVSVSQLRAEYPRYVMLKEKMPLSDGLDVDGLLARTADNFRHEQVNTVDGVKIDFAEGWVHLRKSNTEPIIRLYAEGGNEAVTRQLIDKVRTQLLADAK